MAKIALVNLLFGQVNFSSPQGVYSVGNTVVKNMDKSGSLAEFFYKLLHVTIGFDGIPCCIPKFSFFLKIQ
jgi:hypothetical protein